MTVACGVQFLMLLSQFMNASNLARDQRNKRALAARGLDQAAESLETRASLLRAEAEQVRQAPQNLVGAERSKASILQGVQCLAEAAKDMESRADHLAASAYSPDIGVSSRALASALGVSTNTAIKRIRQQAGEEDRDG